MSNVPTASQTVGPFFSIGLSHLYLPEGAPGHANQDRVTIRGRLLDGDGGGVPDAILEIWQPGVARGSDRGDGFARVATNGQGEFSVSILGPATPGDENLAAPAPHAVVLLFMRGLLRHLVTRVYFPDDPRNTLDPVLQLVPSNRRPTLIAIRSGEGSLQFSWEIRLQGERETVFFEA